MKFITRIFSPLLAIFVFAGCATNFEPKPLPPDHPASVQAQEAPRAGMKRLVTSDELTRKTNAQLARKDVPNPDFQSGMSHDMGNMGGRGHMKGMEGMDHSKMPGMDMGKAPAGAPAPAPEGMDHSKMPGMAMPATSAAPAPPNKEAAELEIKKTSDEMKKLSDEMKARSDAEKSSKKPQTQVSYWTCVMHPEIHETKPGQCPKCGMTLVKKERVPK
ncbi:MAG: heavy metal-binding domain-containing protein [Chthoniobacterales bacterium]